MADAGVLERPLSVDERVSVTRIKVDETKALMQDNLNKAVDRGFKLVDLENIAENLELDARQFKKTSRKLKMKQWARNKKWSLILGAGILILILIIVLVLVISLHHHRSSAVTTTPATPKPIISMTTSTESSQYA